MASVDEIASAVDAATLTPVVREIAGDPRAELGEWTYERLAVVSGLPDHRGLFRFSGSASADEAATSWSAVLKIVQRHPEWSDDPADARFWRREAAAFQSGLLDGIDGLTPVRCYAITDADAETLLVWLEELEDEYDSRWPVERYELAARHLGQMGGAYLAGRALPDHEWLLRRPIGGGGSGGAALAMIEDEKTWQHPEVQSAYPEPIADRLREQWADRRAFQAAVAQMSTTLCHNDAHTENLFSRWRDDGTQETVAVDWELVGIGPVASDITFLVIATLRRLAVDMADADALEEAVLEGYCAGLEDAGWGGHEDEVRRGFTAAVALRLGLVPQTLDLILREDRRAQAERGWNRPVAELIERWAQVAYFVLDRADRARELLRDG